MKGNFKITAEMTHVGIYFPTTEKVCIEVDNTPESIETLFEYFRRLAGGLGYATEVFDDYCIEYAGVIKGED